MTKISFDVDFSEDPEKILQQIQDRAKAEVEKRESKERVSGYLSKLHEKVNEDINTEYKSATDLIKALTPFASPALKDKLSSTSPSGRRKTVSMSKEVFDEIKKLLSEPNPNKAAIGRETGVSVVQVRKVAAGGYDEKFGGKHPFSPLKAPAAKKMASPSSAPGISGPLFGQNEPKQEERPHSETTPGSVPNEEPSSSPEPSAKDNSHATPSSPSIGDDESADEPSTPSAPPSFGDDESPAPPAPWKPGLTRPPSPGAGKPGESKIKGLNLTRPPTPGTPPPADS